MITQAKAKRKPTGGINRSSFTKRISRKGGLPAMTKIDKRVVREKRKTGGSRKQKILCVDKINVFDPKNKKSVVADIKTETGNPANRHFIRRNILTKGAVVSTSIGSVRITSRPGQEGTLNGVLIE